MPAPCPQLKTRGACTDTNCQYRHDVMICEDCRVICTAMNVYQAHLRGKKHARRISGNNVPLHCPACNVNVPGEPGWIQHIRGKRHIGNMQATQTLEEVVPEEAGPSADKDFCHTCAIEVWRAEWQSHLTSAGHCKKEKFTATKVLWEEAEKDKHGIMIPENLDFGIVSPGDSQQGVRLQLRVENAVPFSQVVLVEARLSSANTNHPSPCVSIIYFISQSHSCLIHDSSAFPSPFQATLSSRVDRPPQAQFISVKRSSVVTMIVWKLFSKTKR